MRVMRPWLVSTAARVSSWLPARRMQCGGHWHEVSAAAAAAASSGGYYRSWSGQTALHTSRNNHEETTAVSSLLPPFSLPTTDELEDCWRQDSWSANPDGDTRIDTIMQGLYSPAPQSMYVITRALRQAAVKYSSDNRTTDTNKVIHSVLQQCYHVVKVHWYQLCFRRQSSDKEDTDEKDRLWHRPGIDWTLVLKHDTGNYTLLNTDWTLVTLPRNTANHKNTCTSTSQLAAEILTHVQEASESQQNVDHALLQTLYQRLVQRFAVTLGTDLRGRAASDTAFALCAAGIHAPPVLLHPDTSSNYAGDDGEALYERLADVARLELQRIRGRSTRRVRDVLHVVEKSAAAGLGFRNPNSSVYTLYKIASQHPLVAREPQYETLRQQFTDPTRFNLFADRPLLWLWRFAARQTKAKVLEEAPSLSSLSTDVSWLSKLADTSKPLVLDIGCGLGVSLLGLASLRERYMDPSVKFPVELDWDECNYLGADLSLLGVRFGSGLAARWRLNSRIQYTQSAAEDVVDQVATLYPGKVPLIMIQFPSPYRLKESGNSQLPTTRDLGFMVSQSLMQKIAMLLQKSRGYLLLQSNCEDVAIIMLEMAQAAGLVPVPSTDPVLSLEDMPPNQQTPQRTQEWIAMGGERALGPAWCCQALIPSRTETEAACTVQGTPVHRCLLRPSDQD